MTIATRITAAWRALTAKSANAGWSQTLGGVEVLGNAFVTPSRSGKVVTVDTSLQVATVFAVVKQIAFGIAQMPWKLMKVGPEGRGREPATDHPLYRLLHRRPNDIQTSFDFRVTMMLHLLLTGNFYCFVNRVGSVVVELLPFDPRRVQCRRDGDWGVRYVVTTEAGEQMHIPPEAMWHVRGPSFSGWLGLEPVRLARDAIGLSMVATDAQSDLQKRGAKMPGVLSMEGTLNDKQYADLAGWLKGKGLAAFDDLGILIVDHSARFQPTAMTGADAQTLETRKFQIEEICRFAGIQPAIIGHPADIAARAAMEQIFIAHLVHCLDPWLVNIEQSADCNLLTDVEIDQGLFTRFNRAGMMRAALKDQAEWFAKALGQGSTGPRQAWATVNDVRELLEWNPIAGGDLITDPTAARAAPAEGGASDAS